MSDSGDVNGDGVIDARNPLLIRKLFWVPVVTIDEQLCGDIAPLSADMPATDGALNAADYLILQGVALGEITLP